MNLEKADGSHLTRLSTMHDDVKPVSHCGQNKICLHIDGLPLHGGLYVTSMRLFDTTNGKTIDVHAHRYPFMIIEPENTEQTLYLKHNWSCSE